MSDFKAKIQKNSIYAGGAYSAVPDLKMHLRGLLLRESGGEGGMGRGGDGKGRGGGSEGRGRERRGGVSPLLPNILA